MVALLVADVVLVLAAFVAPVADLGARLIGMGRAAVLPGVPGQHVAVPRLLADHGEVAAAARDAQTAAAASSRRSSPQ
jgi:hypothetical protein